MKVQETKAGGGYKRSNITGTSVKRYDFMNDIVLPPFLKGPLHQRSHIQTKKSTKRSGDVRVDVCFLSIRQKRVRGDNKFMLEAAEGEIESQYL